MNKFYDKLDSWKKSFRSRKNYTTKDRHPFYEIAIPYLPNNKAEVIVDIGAGKGEFVNHLNLYAKYKNVFLLDANKHTIQYLKEKHSNAILYRAPEKLPFEDSTVSFIHSSHMVEYLNHVEFYTFLKEIDRILKDKGILMISAPLLWEEFYYDLSHVRPYYPDVFTVYLCSEKGVQTREVISKNYTIQKLIYRYTTIDSVDWGANSIIFDFIIQLLKKVLKNLGINKYKKNGFTLILQKN
ncbi:MAG: class I SAM-dependent methyltransferase [Bacteroidales bacterium]|nr:MAG: class I SAM-dependent methyltransferase [Bacteroidales bacterium]